MARVRACAESTQPARRARHVRRPPARRHTRAVRPADPAAVSQDSVRRDPRVDLERDRVRALLRPRHPAGRGAGEHADRAGRRPGRRGHAHHAPSPRRRGRRLASRRRRRRLARIAHMSAQAITPEWMHELVTAEQYDSWSEEQCKGIEIVDGMVVVSPSASIRHNRIARVLATALDTAGGETWNADNDFDLRLQDVPLLNRRPDVVVYRADAIDVLPARPQNVLMVVEIVSPGSETTDRRVKSDEYARAGIQFYWRVEQAL